MSKLYAFKSFFKDTATGGGILGLCSAILFADLAGNPSNKRIRMIEKIAVPICTFYGLFHNQYPRFDDKVHLYFTALVGFYELSDLYIDYSDKCAEIDNAYKCKSNALKHESAKKAKEEVRWWCITGLPENIAIYSLGSTAVVEILRYAAKYYNER